MNDKTLITWRNKDLLEAQAEHEEDMRYRMEQDLWENLQSAVSNDIMSPEEALELWEDKNKGFEWLMQ